MDVKTPREINLAFLSLIKLFSEVKVEQKSIMLNPKPRLPSSINPGSAQQVRSSMTKLAIQGLLIHSANAELYVQTLQISAVLPHIMLGQL